MEDLPTWPGPGDGPEELSDVATSGSALSLGDGQSLGGEGRRRSRSIPARSCGWVESQDLEMPASVVPLPR